MNFIFAFLLEKMTLKANFCVTHKYSIELSASYIYYVQNILYQKQLGNISLSVWVCLEKCNIYL